MCVVCRGAHLLELRTTIEVDILLGEQLYWHIVDGLYLLAQHDSLEECINTAEALLIAVLGYKKRDTTLAQTFGILGYHVVAHYLDIPTVCAQKKLAHDVGFGAQRDAMMYVGMGSEEVLKD